MVILILCGNIHFWPGSGKHWLKISGIQWKIAILIIPYFGWSYLLKKPAISRNIPDEIGTWAGNFQIFPAYSEPQSHAFSLKNRCIELAALTDNFRGCNLVLKTARLHEVIFLWWMYSYPPGNECFQLKLCTIFCIASVNSLLLVCILINVCRVCIFSYGLQEVFWLIP